MNVALYLRVSTEEQAKEGYSIASQRERLEAFCKSQGWEIYDYYIDDGFSGKDLNRPAVQRLLKDAKEERFSAVLVYRLDRFSRRAVDILRVVEEVLEPRRISLKSVTESFDTSTIAGRLMLSMLAAFAQFERESIAERVKLNMAHKAKNGEWCGAYQAPFGCKVVNKRLVAVPHEAEVVRMMFEFYAQGKGMRLIAKELNNAGIRTRSGKPWSNVTVRQILTNPVYAGRMVWNRTERKGTRCIRRAKGEWVITEGSHAPIVDVELFERVQAMIESKRSMHMREAWSDYALSGLVYCGHCGHRLRGWHVKRPSGGVVKYYRCTGKEKGVPCPSRLVRAEELEEAVLCKVESAAGNLGAYSETAATAGRRSGGIPYLREQLEKAKQELAAVDQRKQRWFDVFEQGGIGFEDFRERLDHLNREKDEKMRRVEDLEVAISRLEMREITAQKVAEAAKNLRHLWEKFNVSQRKALLRAVAKRVIVSGKGEVRIDFVE